jgi:putative methyltransferase (TIGR04325 family)
MYKKFLKLIIPKPFIKTINKILNRNIRFVGCYKKWKYAAKNSTGYSDKIIFNKTKKSFLKVISNKAKYERDSVLFYSENINYPFINILSKIQSKHKSCLKVLDFGGSFGSTYFQNYSILGNKDKFHWAIIEQKNIVNFFKNLKLKKNIFFFSSINNYIKKYEPDVVLFSSVIQYLEFPNKVINYFIKKKVKNIIFLKTSFTTSNEMIKIQIVPKNIYNASYPIRIFNEKNFLKLFKNNNYRIVSTSLKNEKINNIIFKNYMFQYKDKL